MNTTNKFFVASHLKIMLFAFLLVAGIGHVYSCEEIYNLQTRVTTMRGCPADYGVPPPMPSRTISYGNQGYSQQQVAPQGGVNFGNFDTNNLSTENLITAGAALVGAFNPSGGKGNNRLSTALEYGAVAKIGTMIYDKVTESKPQQVALVEAQGQQAQQTSSSTAKCDGNKTVGILKWPGHPMNGREVCMETNDPHR